MSRQNRKDNGITLPRIVTSAIGKLGKFVAVYTVKYNVPSINIIVKDTMSKEDKSLRKPLIKVTNFSHHSESILLAKIGDKDGFE